MRCLFSNSYKNIKCLFVSKHLCLYSQPNRVGNQRASDDPRTKSFLHILDILQRYDILTGYYCIVREIDLVFVVPLGLMQQQFYEYISVLLIVSHCLISRLIDAFIFYNFLIF